MRKWLALCLSAALILSLFACGETEQTPGSTTTAKPTAPTSPTTPAVDPLTQAKAAIDAGEYEKAYDLLLTIDTDEAAELRNKFVFLPVSLEGYISFDNSITYSYDKQGNVLTEEIVSNAQYRGSKTHTYTYDDNGNILTHQILSINSFSPNGLLQNYSYTYDGNGNAITEVATSDDPNGKNRLTTYTYDTNGNMLTEVIVHDPGTEQERTESYFYSYDTHGNLTHEKHIWSDGDIDEDVYTYSYDQNGKLLSKNNTHFYTYDECGNLTNLEYYHSNSEKYKSLSYTYNSNNQLLTISCVEKDETWYAVRSYDDKGRLLTQTNTNSSGFIFEEKATYDDYGNLTSVVYWDDGEYINYTWELFYLPNGISSNTQHILHWYIGAPRFYAFDQY